MSLLQASYGSLADAEAEERALFQKAVDEFRNAKKKPLQSVRTGVSKTLPPLASAPIPTGTGESFYRKDGATGSNSVQSSRPTSSAGRPASSVAHSNRPKETVSDGVGVSAVKLACYNCYKIFERLDESMCITNAKGDNFCSEECKTANKASIKERKHEFEDMCRKTRQEMREMNEKAIEAAERTNELRRKVESGESIGKDSFGGADIFNQGSMEAMLQYVGLRAATPSTGSK